MTSSSESDGIFRDASRHASSLCEPKTVLPIISISRALLVLHQLSGNLWSLHYLGHIKMFTMMMMLMNSIFEQLSPRNSRVLTPKCFRYSLSFFGFHNQDTHTYRQDNDSADNSYRFTLLIQQEDYGLTDMSSHSDFTACSWQTYVRGSTNTMFMVIDIT